VSNQQSEISLVQENHTFSMYPRATSYTFSSVYQYVPSSGVAVSVSAMHVRARCCCSLSPAAA
jgi:hypothetical protein